LDAEDDAVLTHLENISVPVIAAINKIDRIKNRAELLPFLETLARRRDFAHIVPLSALKRDNLDALERAIGELLPQAPFPFDEDELTTASQRFLAAELIREKLFRQLRDEVPYALAVEIERFEETRRWTASTP
jgi:GTPase